MSDMKRAIELDDVIFTEILNLVSEGYEVSFRKDFFDSFNIRLYKDNINSQRTITKESLMFCTTEATEEFLIRMLARLKADHEYFRRKSNEGNSV